MKKKKTGHHGPPPKKNAYLEKRRVRDDILQDATRNTFEQFTWDCLCIVLNDKEVMGKDVFGRKRIKKIHTAWTAVYKKYIKALLKSDETDAYRVLLDQQLERILREHYAPFEERYYWLPVTEEARRNSYTEE